MEQELNPKQKAFCREYIIDHNGTQAAIRAGYSERTAKQIGSALLTKIYIQSEVGRLEGKIIKATELTAKRILEELMRIAFVDPSGIYHANGTLKTFGELTEDQTRAIAGVDYTKTGQMKYKLNDKIAALDKLGKHLKLFTDSGEINNNFAPNIQIIEEYVKPTSASPDTNKVS